MPLVVFVGRIDQDKRLDVLLQAVSLTKRNDFQLAIVGQGNELSYLQALAQKLHLGRQVVFTGYIPDEDLPILHNSADLFVMPSIAELQSIATLEAMASGKPVLAAEARALPELVTNGVNGYLFKPDDPLDAARRLSQLLDERDYWVAMGQASLFRAAQHSLSQTIHRYEEVYTALLPLRRTAPSRLNRLESVQRFLKSI
jgi:glycosyltransferase involved in cell wall biosynthesis